MSLESNNIIEFYPAGKEKGKVKVGDERDFIATGSFAEIFNVDLTNYKGRISVLVYNNDPVVDMEVQIIGAIFFGDNIGGIVTSSPEEQNIQVPNSSEDGIVSALSSKVFTINPLIRWTAVQVNIQYSTSGANNTVNAMINCEEF